MKEKYYTYIHYYMNNDNQKIVFYVGCAKGNSNRAFDTKQRPIKWHEIVNFLNGKYLIEIVKICKDKHESQSEERKLMCYYHDIGQAEASQEDIRGERHWIYGKTHTPEVREKISKSHKGKEPWNKGLKGAQTAWNKGLKGQTTWNKGLKGKQVAWNKGIKTGHKSEEAK